MKKEGKKIAVTAAACAFLGVLAMGGTMAYLTDMDQETNTFTVGKVEVDLEEPDYPGNDSEKVEHLVPNQEVLKNPQISNTGINEALVFMTVTVPVKEVTLVDADGTKGEKEAADLFWFKDEEDASASAANNWDDSWIRLMEKDYFTSVSGENAANLEEAAGGSHTYVFAYKEAIAGETKTSALFDKVQLKNIIENEVTAGEAQNIEVKAYAIQAAAILENGDTDLTETVNESNMSKIYDIYLKQNDIAR